ncbi:MAG: malonyl-ACP O-methyltransferase BioC [Povalibacter sp.]
MSAPPSDEFTLLPKRVRRGFDKAAATFDGAAAVHGEIRARLLERLDVVRLKPENILDLGAGTGQGSRSLQERYSRALIVAFDLSLQMLIRARRQQRWLRPFQRVAGDAHRLPLRDSTIDMVFSNLMLQWSHDPDAIFKELRRVMRPQGLLTFATLGPDTLKEIRTAWRQVDNYTHVHRFIDMHDWGDALMRAGFAEPVMDTERLTITYADSKSLFAELRSTGSTNVSLGRRQGLMSRRVAGLFEESHSTHRRDGLWPVTLEVVYGHAWTAESTKPRPQGEAVVPFSSIARRRR